MINEVSPPGWGHTKAEKEKTKPDKPKSKIGGTAHAMKLAQKRGDIPKNMNIFALMWSMKNKGDKPHYKPGVKGKLKGKYKGPEGQNEMIDPKKIRNYKNVPNSVVAKADKEAEKVKDKEQKGTLEFPQMPTEESTWSKNFKKQGAKRRGETRRRQQAQQHSPGQRVLPKPKNYGEDMSLAPKGKGKKAAKALYKEEDIDMPSLVQQAINELTPDQKKKREASRTHSTLGKGRRLHGGRSAAHPKGAMVSGKTHTYDKPAGTAKKPGRQKIVATPVKKEGTEGDALVKAVANSPKQQALKKKQMLSITPAGKKAVKKGDQKLSITPKGLAAVKELDYKKFGFETQDDLIEYAVAYYMDEKMTPQQRRAREGMRTASQGKAGRKSGTMMPARGDFSKTYDRKKQFKKNIGPQGTPAGIAAHKAQRGVKKVKGAKEETTHFGDVLRQAIEEAKKVNAIDTINKIVKTKTMGKLHGQKVDLFTASAIQQVYNALNKKNQQKMTSVMSKDVHGLLKMADFSMKQMKR